MCMCVCTCVNVYVCTCVNVYVYTCVCVYMCEGVCAHMYMYVCSCVNVFVYMYVHVNTCVNICACMCVCVLCLTVYAHMCVHVRMCVHEHHYTHMLACLPPSFFPPSFRYVFLPPAFLLFFISSGAKAFHRLSTCTMLKAWVWSRFLSEPANLPILLEVEGALESKEPWKSVPVGWEHCHEGHFVHRTDAGSGL